MAKHYYFAYGMNTDPHEMQYTSLCNPIGKARLVGWHLEIQYFANVVEGGEMEGVLWEIDDETLEQLDQREGYPHLYTRRVVNVFHESDTYGAVIYTMTDHYTKLGRERMPSTHYVISILRGYKTFDIPASQLTDAINSLTTLNYENH